MKIVFLGKYFSAENCFGKMQMIYTLIEERQKEMELEQTAAKAPKTSSNNASTFKRNKRRSIQETFKHNPIIAEILESMLLDVEGDFTEASLKSRIVF